MNSRELQAALILGEDVPQTKESMAPLGRALLMKLLAAYGRAPKIRDFFDLYAELKDVFDSGEPLEDGDLYTRLRLSASAMEPRFDLQTTRDKVDMLLGPVQVKLRRIDNGIDLPDQQWRELIQNYADLIQAAGADKRIFITTRRLPGRSPIRWLRLQRASSRETSVEKLRRDDPDLYQRTREDQHQRREIANRIQKRIREDGLVPEVRMVMRRPMNVGIDPNSRELAVYDSDGDVLTVEEFSTKVKDRRLQQDTMMGINLPSDPLYSGIPTVKDVERHGLRRLPAERLAELDGDPDETIALTDDPDKASRLTRIYPVKYIDGEKVVSQGRFKGMHVSDLVNATGRQIEGSLYYIDPQKRRVGRRQVKNPDGSLDMRPQREPYITVDGDKLYLKIAGENAFAPMRQEMDRMAGGVPSIDKIQRVRNTGFRFELKDFDAVREVVGSVALSSRAANLLRDYYEELTKAEQASNAGNLSRYSSEELGLKLPLRNHTKRALAWLDANDNKGICALDTGMGKTVTAISSMLNLIRKGVGSGTNGRFLYVCEKALLGNLPKEMYKFMDKMEADELMARTDITTYYRFNAVRRKNPSYGDDYIAIYFDEAHIRMNKKTKSSYKTAVDCRCEHKVLLTASPMVKGPKEVYTMASVANGIDLNTPEGAEEERKYLSRFSQSVGGRTTGITRDPRAAKDFRIWVKRNLFFADKRDADEEESQLPETNRGMPRPGAPTGRDIRKLVETVTMPPEIEKVYRAEMDAVREGLGDALHTFRQQPELAYEALSRALKRPLALLSRLADVPNRVIPGAPNPKLDRATEILKTAVQGRSLMFTDNRELAEDTFARMRKQFPGKGHVMGQTDFILYATPTGEEIKYTERRYIDPETGRKTPKDEWKTHVLTKILGLGTYATSKSIMTAVLTGSYAVGQNLQSFGTVIHLDRDDWNNETMKQRTARAWRSGNGQAVDEYTMDMVYPEPVANAMAEQTLDEIRKVIQEIDDKMFDDIVVESQREKLGEEWLAIKQQRSDLYTIDRRMLERMLSPYASHLGLQEGGE